MQNPQDGIAALHDLADKNNIMLSEYILDTDRALVAALEVEGMGNLRKPLDQMDAPELGIKEPDYIRNYGMDGPRQGFGLG